tara:strand:- start:5133 stop:5771 length:639 start_codon:yes stop_codon:yes gene_type:complete
MKKIKLYLISFLLQIILYVVFKTNRWKVVGEENLKVAIKKNQPIFLCTWHARFVYAMYFLKLQKTKNIWAISSTHQDSQIMAYFLKRSSFNLIRGSSTRGWDNVIKKMIKILKDSSSIIAITNDGPKGPPQIAKYGSYQIAKRSNAQIISIFGNSTKFWELKSWDKLRIPKPFGTIYIQFSSPMDYSKDETNNSNALTTFLNKNLDSLDQKV